MKITILALGSRGDVQPFVALGVGLKAAGYQVRVAAAADYRDLAEAYGLDFAPIVGSIRELMDRQMVSTMLEGRNNPVRFLRDMMQAIRPLVRRLLADCYEACRDADALVLSTLGLYAGYDVAEALGLPTITAHYHPDVATSAFPHVFFPRLPRMVPLGSLYNKASYGLTDAAYWAMILRGLNEARHEFFGLPKLSPFDITRRVRHPLRPVLHGYSPAITRTPPDWGHDVFVTGYWFLDRPPGWEPPGDLVHFLASGPAPVYIGFGSILVGSDPDEVTRTIVAALARTGQRGILMSGWGDLGNIRLPDTVLKVDDVPHEWLFPQVKAVVCHGGAGTTAAALRAGVPPLLVPFLGDQHFWARRVASMGLGPKPIQRRHLSVDTLAAGISQAVNNREIKARAAKMGRRIAAERGVETAVELISRALASH